MASYIKTISEFLLEDSQSIIGLLFKESTASVSQIKSWEVLIDDLKRSNLNFLDSSINVAIEYSLPIDGMGIDLLIAGVNKGGQKRVYIIEAKQWVDSNIYEYTFGEGRGDDVELHPQIQVWRHAVAFKDYLDIGEEYTVFPFVYTKNLSNKALNILIDKNPLPSTSKIPIKQSLNEIITIIKSDLESSTPDILNDLQNAKYKPSKSITKAMNSIVTRNDPFILTKEQEDVVKQVLSAFSNGKKIVRITGAAGSGKTAILLHLYVRFLNESNDEKRPIFVSGAQNTKLYQSLFREVERSFTFSFSLNKMVSKSLGSKYYIFMDEAQHNKEGIITDMINRGAHLVLCYDPSQTINANNSLQELEMLQNRNDFISIELKNSVRFSGSQVFEINAKKVLNGDNNLLEDDKFDFMIFDTIEELEKHTISVIQNNPNSTVAITGLLSNDASEIANRTDSQIFINWGYLGETRWYPYIENKDYLNQYNGKLWVGTWWLPGLDVDYVSVIVGGDAKMTNDGLIAIPEGAKHYQMMISIAEELNYPKTVYVMRNDGKINTVKTALKILEYIEEDAKRKMVFINRFSELLKNNYYILLTRGRKGCYVCFLNK